MANQVFLGTPPKILLSNRFNIAMNNEPCTIGHQYCNVKFYYFLITMLGFMDCPCPGSFQKVMAKTLNLTDRLILSQPWLAWGVHRGMFYKLTYFLQGPINRSQSNDCCFNCLQKRWTVFSWPQYSKNKASTVCSFTW